MGMKLLNDVETFRANIEAKGAVSVFDSLVSDYRSEKAGIESQIKREYKWDRSGFFAKISGWIIAGILTASIVVFWGYIGLSNVQLQQDQRDFNIQKQKFANYQNSENSKFAIYKNSEMNRIHNMEIEMKKSNDNTVLKEQAYTEKMRRMLIAHGIDPDPNWRSGSPIQK